MGMRDMLGKDRVRDARRIAICIRDGLRCRYCGRKVTCSAQIDHVIPVARGGPRTDDNLVLSCSRCNRAKSDTPVEEWYGSSIEPGIVTPEIQQVAREIASKSRRNRRKRNRLVNAYMKS